MGYVHTLKLLPYRGKKESYPIPILIEDSVFIIFNPLYIDRYRFINPDYGHLVGPNE